MDQLLRIASELHSVIAPLAIAAMVLGWLSSKVRDIRNRTICLRAAHSAMAEFYDLADRLLKDPATPERAKALIYDMLLAVTDDKAGEITFDVLLRSLDEMNEKGKRISPPDSLSSTLDELRKHRGDLYDDVINALRSAFAAVVLTHGSDQLKIDVEYRATRNSSIMLALSSKLDSVLSDMKRSDNGGSWRPARV